MCVCVRSVCVWLPVTGLLLGDDPDEQKVAGGLTLPVLMSDAKMRNQK